MKANATKSNNALGTWIRMLKAHNLILRKARKRLNSECTLAQFDVLAQLQRQGGSSTLAELSRQLLVTAGNITGVVDRMEEAGMVQREPDNTDRRVTRVRLTARGKALSRKVIQRHGRDVQDFFSVLSEREMEQLRTLIEKLVKHLEPAK